jgi:hypothetical protein
MSLRSLAVVAVVLSAWAMPAQAQGIELRFHEGLVTLSTQNAPLSAILTEWAKQGGTTIVNGEKVAGAPMSLQLDAVPERQALEVLLRGVSGYMLAPRPTGTPGVSVFDRIMILPTSAAPVNAAAPAGRGFPTASAAPRPPFPRPSMPPPPVMPEPEELEEEDPPQDIAPEDAEAIEEAEEEPQVVTPQVRPRPMPRAFPGLIPGGQPMPFQIPDDQPEEVEPDDAETQPTAQPGNPFGIPAGTTSRPGVVTPVPRGPQQQRTPRTDPEP